MRASDNPRRRASGWRCSWLAPRLVGRDLDRFAQAVEGEPECRIVSVQRHPGYLFYLPSQFRLFRWPLSKANE